MDLDSIESARMLSLKSYVVSAQTLDVNIPKTSQ
jgi:hypothetical protein